MSLCTPSPCLDKPVAWIYTFPCGPPSCWGRWARCSPCWGRARPSCSSTGPRQRWAHPPLSVSVNVRPKYFSWVFTCLQRGHVLRLADQHSLIEFWPTLTDAKKWMWLRNHRPAENVAFSALGNRGQAESAAGAGNQSQQGLSIQKWLWKWSKKHLTPVHQSLHISFLPGEVRLPLLFLLSPTVLSRHCGNRPQKLSEPSLVVGLTIFLTPWKFSF